VFLSRKQGKDLFGIKKAFFCYGMSHLSSCWAFAEKKITEV